MKIVFAAFKDFKFGVKMKIFHFLNQDIAVDTKLQHFNRVKKRVLLLSGQYFMQRLPEQRLVLLNLQLLNNFVEREKLLDRIRYELSAIKRLEHLDQRLFAEMGQIDLFSLRLKVSEILRIYGKECKDKVQLRTLSDDCYVGVRILRKVLEEFLILL